MASAIGSQELVPSSRVSAVRPTGDPRRAGLTNGTLWATQERQPWAAPQSGPLPLTPVTSATTGATPEFKTVHANSARMDSRRGPSPSRQLCEGHRTAAAGIGDPVWLQTFGLVPQVQPVLMSLRRPGSLGSPRESAHTPGRVRPPWLLSCLRHTVSPPSLPPPPPSPPQLSLLLPSSSFSKVWGEVYSPHSRMRTPKAPSPKRLASASAHRGLRHRHWSRAAVQLTLCGGFREKRFATLVPFNAKSSRSKETMAFTCFFFLPSFQKPHAKGKIYVQTQGENVSMSLNKLSPSGLETPAGRCVGGGHGTGGFPKNRFVGWIHFYHFLRLIDTINRGKR